MRIAAARDIFEGVQTHWRETQRPEADTAFSRVRDALAGLLTPRPHSLSKTALSGRVKEAFRVGIRAAILHAAAWRQIESIGAGAVYLNVSQYPLEEPV